MGVVFRSPEASLLSSASLSDPPCSVVGGMRGEDMSETEVREGTKMSECVWENVYEGMCMREWNGCLCCHQQSCQTFPVKRIHKWGEGGGWIDKVDCGCVNRVGVLIRGHMQQIITKRRSHSPLMNLLVRHSQPFHETYVTPVPTLVHPVFVIFSSDVVPRECIHRRWVRAIEAGCRDKERVCGDSRECGNMKIWNSVLFFYVGLHSNNSSGRVCVCVLIWEGVMNLNIIINYQCDNMSECVKK